MRWVRLCRALACACAVAPLAAVAACGAGVPRPVPVQVLSNYERNGTTIGRDCGYSSPLPGRPGWSLWLFCDTVIASVRSGKTERLILGTDTAAAGPYRAGYAPARLSEIPTPPAPLTLPGAGAPQPFLPGPQRLLLPGSTLPCAGPGAYPASWISGVAREPPADTAAHLLISYDDYCVTGNADALTAEGFGLIEYDPARNLLSWPAEVFTSLPGLPLPPQQVLGSPVFSGDGYLYLFGFCPAGYASAGCGRGGVFAVRTVARPTYWQNPLTYQYWTGGGWSPDEAAARTLMPPGHPFGISVGDYTADGHGLVMVEQTSLAGAFQVWQARSPAGPWQRIITGQVPCRRGPPSAEQRACAVPSSVIRNSAPAASFSRTGPAVSGRPGRLARGQEQDRVEVPRERPQGPRQQAAPPPRKCQCCSIVCSHVPAPGTGAVVGIDRGVAVSAALSTGELLRCPALTGRERIRLRRLQRTLARAKRGSNRRGRVRHAIARLKVRETDRRTNWAEKASTDIARRFDVIRVEDLQIGNMTRSAKGTRGDPGRNVRQKAGLNRGILRSGWGLLVRRLQDKAPGRVEKVRPQFTSQRCSACGQVDRDSRESQAVFRCTACGYACHADVNAARNIAAGHAVTARGGDGVARPVNREPQLLLQLV